MYDQIKHGGSVVAIVIRNKEFKKGLNFVTAPQNPIQVATHKYTEVRETSIHGLNLRRSVKLSQFHKYLFIVKGSANVYLMNKRKKVMVKKRLSKGDSIVIMYVCHKVIFSKNTSAIEIKQGPYEPDT